jgi:hypothetical protein
MITWRGIIFQFKRFQIDQKEKEEKAKMIIIEESNSVQEIQMESEDIPRREEKPLEPKFLYMTN